MAVIVLILVVGLSGCIEETEKFLEQEEVKEVIEKIEKEFEEKDIPQFTPKPEKPKATKQELSLSVVPSSSFHQEPTAGSVSLPVVMPGQELMFPLLTDYVALTQRIFLSLTFRVTDAQGASLDKAQIFMREALIGSTDSRGELIYDLILPGPHDTGNTPATLPFSARKGEASVTVDVPLYVTTVLDQRTLHINQQAYEDAKEVLYLYHLGQPSFPLPEQLKYLGPFIPLLKTAGDLEALQLGDVLTRQILEYKVPNREPAAWAYVERIERNRSIIHSRYGWIFTQEEKQRIMETYFPPVA